MVKRFQRNEQLLKIFAKLSSRCRLRTNYISKPINYIYKSNDGHYNMERFLEATQNKNIGFYSMSALIGYKKAAKLFNIPFIEAIMLLTKEGPEILKEPLKVFGIGFKLLENFWKKLEDERYYYSIYTIEKSKPRLINLIEKAKRLPEPGLAYETIRTTFKALHNVVAYNDSLLTKGTYWTTQDKIKFEYLSMKVLTGDYIPPC